MFARFSRPAAVTLGALALSFCITGEARADFLFSWDFTNSGQTVKPNETFTARAVITNQSTTGEVLTGADIQGYGAGLMASSLGTFGYTFGSGGNLYSEFAGMNLKPGESYEFTYFTFEHTGALELGSRHGLDFAFLSARGLGQLNAETLPFEFFVGVPGQDGKDGGDPLAFGPATFATSAPVGFENGENGTSGAVPGTIPEPVTLLLFGLGLGAVARRRARR
jgi:hypothetical protein